MAVSWARRIAVIEPAPRTVRYARYLAPHWKGLTRLESDNCIGLFPAVLLFTLAALSLFGAGGAALAWLTDELTGHRRLPYLWLVFDALAAASLAVSYWLVSRYALRFYEAEPSSSPTWRLVTIANTAWRCLPAHHRDAQKPRLRAINTAARLLLTDPDDSHTHRVLTEHADALRHLATTVLHETQQDQQDQQDLGGPALPFARSGRLKAGQAAPARAQ
ncbi:hypothetical protein ACFYM2_07640 [Streptomyces sp. NPDC006711]|uniref:hypothetical protein n=1 Tax=Streptomyces sp. NPDC006711 TaxID=3364762 RepID=UPI0036C88767